ncbi:MAG: SDR family oxidoreductase [Wenzhouxiangella sp.]
MDKERLAKEDLPPQDQELPGDQSAMSPEPETIRSSYRGSDKLKDKVALITGGDSGIGRSAAVHFAREGANVAVIYLEEDEDAEITRKMVEAEGADCLLIRGDIGDRKFAKSALDRVMRQFKQLNILVNNAGEQHVRDGIEEIDLDTVERTFQTNILAMFYLTHAAIPHLRSGDCIINTSSVVAYQGRKYLIDYAATKGAIASFTQALSDDLVSRGIRVNAVAPGPIWTPLIAASFDDEHIVSFGKSTPVGRPGQPSEVGPAYVFLASRDASYISGQTIHVNGGEAVGS